MLDYDLVTAKAAYRILTPQGVSSFVEMTQRCRAEERSASPDARASALATVRELTKHKRAGSIFLIERGPDVVGYSIVINHWSSRLGRNLLCLDELYVAPEHRGLGIATDFIQLLATIAPGDSVAMRIEVPAGNRKAAALCRRLGFADADSRAVLKPIGTTEG